MSAIAFRTRNAWPFVVAAALAACTASKNDNAGPTPTPTPTPTPAPTPDPIKTAADKTFDEGQQIFRFDTFGDEAFWTGKLRMNEAIAKVDPTTALSVGLKVDAEALPAAVVAGIKSGAISLTDPKSTIALLGLNAVVGVKAVPDASGTGLTSFGITCALCHSTVDNSVAPGIGKRLDGWPNRDLNVGAIVNLSPDLSAVEASLGGIADDTLRNLVLTKWGPGKFDAEVFLDGRAFKPDGTTATTLIPPAFGLRGVNLHTWNGWGAITQWNAFVAVLEMHGQGNYTDTRLDDAAKFPLAAANKLGHTTPKDAAGHPAPDLVTSKLGALQFYQLALEAPKPAAGSFDAAAAVRGEAVFNGGGKCATCHMAPTFSDSGWNMHTGAEIGIDEFQASRSPDGKYRTSPLRGLFAHDLFTSQKPAVSSGYYHDGRFATLKDVVDHYAAIPALALSLQGTDEADLIEYLKSL
jgi:mono/diheme cytochrome c family protein